jgi:adenylate cyclase
MTRRLAAILTADVVGYSRLMEHDEAGTLAALKAHRSELVDPLIAEHGGRVVKLMGDGALVEFPSVVDAVTCAVAVQNGMAQRNAEVPEAQRIRFRIGINLGDVISDDDDIYGDGVNIAARLEALAEPGGVCVSGTVYEHVTGKVDVAFIDDGEHTVKNITRPVRVWRWAEAGPPAARLGDSDALPLRDRPSIAVLPFTNMSGDPEQDHFGDGITEDVITELSRFRSLFVIARNSTFTYKGKSVSVQKVARELGVRYVVEGSVRTAANRVRVTAQLIDAESGNHLWAERYDRDLTDIFAVQDEITRSIVTAVAPEVLIAEDASALRKAPENLNAWECVVRGNARMWNVTREDFAAAAALYDQAITLDPNYASAHSAKAYLTVWNAFQGWGGRISDELAQSVASARRALNLDSSDAMAHYAAGFVHTLARNPERAIEEQHTAIKLNPNSADAHFGLAMALAYAGEAESALKVIDAARQLNPRGSFDPILTAFQGLAQFCAGHDEEAARLAARSIEERQDFVVSHLVFGAALGHLGRIEDARDSAGKVLQLYPTFRLAKHERSVPIACAADRARYIEGLHKIGLPE